MWVLYIQVWYADDTRKVNFCVRPVDAGVFANPNGADDAFARKSNASGEFAEFASVYVRTERYVSNIFVKFKSYVTQKILPAVAGFRSGLSTELQGQTVDRFRIYNFASARFYFYLQYIERIRRNYLYSYHIEYIKHHSFQSISAAIIIILFK
jgi:hypothetical protein